MNMFFFLTLVSVVCPFPCESFNASLPIRLLHCSLISRSLQHKTAALKGFQTPILSPLVLQWCWFIWPFLINCNNSSNWAKSHSQWCWWNEYQHGFNEALNTSPQFSILNNKVLLFINTIDSIIETSVMPFSCLYDCMLTIVKKKWSSRKSHLPLSRRRTFRWWVD